MSKRRQILSLLKTSFLIILNGVYVISLPLSPESRSFGIILDAGSSSTKIRIYSWADTIDTVPKFEETFYNKVSPGISAFNDDFSEIAKYINTILDILKGELPETTWSHTPLYFMATAGERSACIYEPRHANMYLVVIFLTFWLLIFLERTKRTR